MTSSTGAGGTHAEPAVNERLRAVLASLNALTPLQREQALHALVDAQLYVTGDAREVGLKSVAYRGAQGVLVLPVFTDPAALESWARTWSTDAVPYGSMPARNILRGANKLGIDVVAVNLAGPNVLLLDRNKRESLLALE